MNRLEWVLGIVLVVLLGLVVVLALLFWFRPFDPNAAPEFNSATIIAQRAQQVAPTPIFAGQTAQLAYATAQRRASDWHGDAQLLRATASWPQGASAVDLLEGTATWGFTFYSPGSTAVANIAVVEDEARWLGESAHQLQQPPLAASGWNLDSREAIARVLSDGGSEFIESERITTLIMVLTTDNENGRIEWVSSLIAPGSGRSLVMRIDATSGEVLEVDKS